MTKDASDRSLIEYRLAELGSGRNVLKVVSEAANQIRLHGKRIQLKIISLAESQILPGTLELPDDAALAILHSPPPLDQEGETLWTQLSNSLVRPSVCYPIVFVNNSTLSMTPRRIVLGNGNCRYLLPVRNTSHSLLDLGNAETAVRWRSLVTACLDPDRLQTWSDNGFRVDRSHDEILTHVFPPPSPAREDFRIFLAGWIMANADILLTSDLQRTSPIIEVLIDLKMVQDSSSEIRLNFVPQPLAPSEGPLPLLSSFLNIVDHDVSSFRQELLLEIGGDKRELGSDIERFLGLVSVGKEPDPHTVARALSQLK